MVLLLDELHKHTKTSRYWSSGRQIHHLPLRVDFGSVMRKCLHYHPSHLSSVLHGVTNGGDGARDDAGKLANQISEDTFLKKVQYLSYELPRFTQ